MPSTINTEDGIAEKLLPFKKNLLLYACVMSMVQPWGSSIITIFLQVLLYNSPTHAQTTQNVENNPPQTKKGEKLQEKFLEKLGAIIKIV